MLKAISILIRKPNVQLILLALASLLIYLFAFVRPYSLVQWGSTPGLTVAKITNYDPRAGAVFVLAMLMLFLLAWLASRAALRWHTRSAWGIILSAAVSFNVLMLALYPVDAVDVFDYIIRARMQAFDGANPFYQPPAQVPALHNDPFYRYAGWPNVPTAYGPWWEMIAAGVAHLPGNGLIANVVTFKSISVLASFGTLFLIALALKHYAPERALYGVVFYAWNPLLIYSVAGNGHNDALMAFFAVLGFFFLARGHFTVAALAEVGGALVKFIPALLFPIVVVYALKRMQTWGVRIRYLLVTGVSAAVLTALSYGYYWRGGDILGQDWRSHLFTTSLATLADIVLQQQHYAPKIADLIVSRGAGVVMAAWVGWQLVLQWRRTARTERQDWESAIAAGIAVLIFYLLITCLWFQPWYTIWPLALAALLPDTMLSRGSIVVMIAGALKMPVFDFAMRVRPGHVPPLASRELQVTLGTMSIAWLYFAYHLARSKIAQPIRHFRWAQAEPGKRRKET